MTTPPVRFERRVGQRFPYLIPVKIHTSEPSLDGAGFTQDLSSRGVFFFTELPLADGMEIELTLRMPSEITLGESMAVRCKGRVLRTLRPVGQSPRDGSPANEAESKIGVALRIENYDYLTEAPDPTAARITQIHPDRDEERNWAQSTARG